MDLSRSLSRRAHPVLVAAAGLAVLAAGHMTGSWVLANAEPRRSEWLLLAKEREKAAAAAADLQSLRDLKAEDVARLKASLAGLTDSRRAAFEAGLALQEEKRLLEKQWEIMTTYLLIDLPERKIHLMRGDQSLKSFALSYSSAALGGLVAPLPQAVWIVSKERFAHPERGVSEQKDGQLQYEPPQVGTSVRANALGEFVMFFTGGLVLHGPARNLADHAAFPHHCAGLPLAAAKKLYLETFIGTKLVFKKTPGP
ncbi:MAG: L,D-transpeptidase [Elusimicrobia bacterium]|nr:L,D-transpeptidase [Elusimicrobiota bacterium]